MVAPPRKTPRAPSRLSSGDALQRREEPCARGVQRPTDQPNILAVEVPDQLDGDPVLAEHRYRPDGMTVGGHVGDELLAVILVLAGIMQPGVAAPDIASPIEEDNTAAASYLRSEINRPIGSISLSFMLDGRIPLLVPALPDLLYVASRLPCKCLGGTFVRP